MIRKQAETLYRAEMAAIARIKNAEETAPAVSNARLITLAMEYLQRLKQLVLEGTFESRESEVYFFKSIKPLFNAQLMYYVMLQKLEQEKPYKTEALLRNYYENRLKDIRKYFSTRKEIYSYYRSGATDLDEQLFTRGQSNLPIWLICPRIDYDERCCTAGDYAFAQIIAYDWLSAYIDAKLNTQTAPKVIENQIQQAKIRWTGEQVNLVELIYGLYYTGQINHGNVEVKDILALVERVFDVKIKAAYHVFGNIRRRKNISPTAFLDKMREAIIKRVDDDLAYHPHKDKLRNRL